MQPMAEIDIDAFIYQTVMDNNFKNHSMIHQI